MSLNSFAGVSGGIRAVNNGVVGTIDGVKHGVTGGISRWEGMDSLVFFLTSCFLWLFCVLINFAACCQNMTMVEFVFDIHFIHQGQHWRVIKSWNSEINCKGKNFYISLAFALILFNDDLFFLSMSCLCRSWQPLWPTKSWRIAFSRPSATLRHSLRFTVSWRLRKNSFNYQFASIWP